MTKRAAALASLAVLTIVAAGACNLNIEPTDISGTVTAREIKHPRVGTATASDYYITVGGNEFQVYASTYDACQPGKQYPGCKR